MEQQEIHFKKASLVTRQECNVCDVILKLHKFAIFAAGIKGDVGDQGMPGRDGLQGEQGGWLHCQVPSCRVFRNIFYEGML